MTERTERLQRKLGTPDMLFIGINGIVGGGIFLLPSQVAGLAGPGAVLAYLVAGLLVFLVGLCYAELGTMYERTGGPLVYVQEAMGKTAGFTVGWMVWVTYVLGWAALSNGFVNYLGSLWAPAADYRWLIVLGIVGALCMLNTIGVRTSAGVIRFLTVAKLLPLAVIIVAGLTFAGVSGNAFLGEVPSGSGGLLAAALVVIFAYGGFEAVAIPAGEMVNPRRTIAVALPGTLIVVTLFYMLIQYSSLRILPDLAGTESPLSAVGATMFAGGLVLITVGALISISGTQTGVALVSSRTLYALSHEGMLPAVLGRIHPRFATPAVSIWLTGALVAILAVTGTFQQLILLNVAARLYQYLMVCISALIMRFREPGAERPFRMPLGITIPVVASALILLLFAQQSPANLLAALGALLLGILLYAGVRYGGSGGRRSGGRRSGGRGAGE